MKTFDSITTLAATAGAMLVAGASPGTGAAPSSPEAKTATDQASPPVETKSALVPSPTTVRPEPAKDAALLPRPRTRFRSERG